MTLAIFDLDNTLLTGDSDVLWCEFLGRHGQIGPEALARNSAMDAAYRAGLASAIDFCSLYVGLMAGRSPAFWAPWRERFLSDEILPRLPAAARTLVDQHRGRGDTLVMSTATHRVIAERTAQVLGIEHLIATEVEQLGPVYSGRTLGTLNMREGKVARLHAWLASQGMDAAAREQALASACFYSDSINDLPLLLAVGQPVVVDPDPRLQAEAEARGWPVLRLARGA